MGRSFTFCLLHRFRRRRVQTERQVLSACVTKRRNYLRLRAHYSRLRVQIPIGCSRICQLAWRRGLLFYGYIACASNHPGPVHQKRLYHANLSPEPDAGAVVGGWPGFSESLNTTPNAPNLASLSLQFTAAQLKNSAVLDHDRHRSPLQQPDHSGYRYTSCRQAPVIFAINGSGLSTPYRPVNSMYKPTSHESNARISKIIPVNELYRRHLNF